jgi:transposase-like protein
MSQKTNTLPIMNFGQRNFEYKSQIILPDSKPQDTSQFVFQLQHQTPELPKCLKCRTKQHVIKYGFRRSKYKGVQRFQCRNCNQTFSIEPLKRTSYPPDIIISTISKYNLGTTIAQTKKYIYRRFKTKVPKTTIRSWLERYADICTFTHTLRKQFDIDPNIIIKSKKFYHQQIYEFKFHTLKTNIAGKTFPQLKSYITSIYKVPYFIPETAFQAGPRCSQMRINIRPKRITKNNNATKMAELAQTLAKTNHDRHTQVEKFFLINDTATIATEVPVYLKPNELPMQERFKYSFDLKDTLSGHIDIIQVRFNNIHILDYKPDAKINDKAAADQLFLYAIALSKRTKVSLHRFICAYFDENNYFEFSPNLANFKFI